MVENVLNEQAKSQRDGLKAATQTLNPGSEDERVRTGTFKAVYKKPFRRLVLFRMCIWGVMFLCCQRFSIP